MRQVYLFICLLVGLGGCLTQKRPTMTIETFHETHIGMSEELLVKTYGPPFNTYHQDNEVIVYEYVERFNMGAAEQRVVEARRYYFFIHEGKVVSKQMAIKNIPGYDPMYQL